jgi:hypothetical protein
VSSIRWWRRLIPPLLTAALLLPTSLPASAAGPYQASIDANVTAFNPPCDPDPNPFVPKMKNAAVAAYARLGHVATGFSGKAFTRAATLARTASDWGYYVHSHGDFYLNADGKRYTGFREDSGDCVQSVVFSKDIKAKRAGRQSNLVFISTCFAADGGKKNTTMPDAFGIQKGKAITTTQGPEFYVGYIGEQWDADEWVFEQRFWNSLAARKSVGASFDVAILGNFNDPAFDADWWGTYHWSGVAGPWTTCANCS